MDQFRFSEGYVCHEDYRMIEEFGDFYSLCEFNPLRAELNPVFR
jgi:hypothetical protein